VSSQRHPACAAARPAAPGNPEFDAGELRQKIAAAAAVSFDFFDTLFVRPLLDPEDLFDLIGRRYGIDNFRRLRQSAQAEAFRRMRQAKKREITLEGIYACLAPLAVPAAEIMRAEYAMELSLAQPNLELVALFSETAASGKPVVVTSDMYLPARFFREALQRHGLAETPLYISCERNATKRDAGELFALVVADLGVAPDRLLHIGDNARSDVAQAEARGVAAYHYRENRRLPPPLRQYVPEAALAGGLLRRHRGQIQPDSFQEMGFLYGGPAAVGFLDWIAERARRDEIDHLLFLARDGYVLDGIARSRPDQCLPKFTYFRGSRTAFTLAAITEKNFADALPFLLSGAEGLSAHELLERINVPAPADRVLEDIGLGAGVVATQARMQQMADFLHAWRWEILKVCRRNRRALLAYLRELGIQPGSRIALVDIGWNGTTQNAFENAIENFFDLQVFGYYFCLANTPERLQRQQTRRMAALVSSPSTAPEVVAKIFANRVAVELLFSAPHASISGYALSADGGVVAVEDPGRGDNGHLAQVNAEILHGSLLFARDYHRLRRELQVPTSPLAVAEPLIQFVTQPKIGHPLFPSVRNFDGWSSTRNRDISLVDYLNGSSPA